MVQYRLGNMLTWIALTFSFRFLITSTKVVSWWVSERGTARLAHTHVSVEGHKLENGTDISVFLLTQDRSVPLAVFEWILP